MTHTCMWNEWLSIVAQPKATHIIHVREKLVICNYFPQFQAFRIPLLTRQDAVDVDVTDLSYGVAYVRSQSARVYDTQVRVTSSRRHASDTDRMPTSSGKNTPDIRSMGDRRRSSVSFCQRDTIINIDVAPNGRAHTHLVDSDDEDMSDIQRRLKMHRKRNYHSNICEQHEFGEEEQLWAGVAPPTPDTTTQDVRRGSRWSVGYLRVGSQSSNSLQNFIHL